jgi:hypothetical protein
LIVGIAVFVVLLLIIVLVVYTLYFLYKTDKHNRRLYKYIQNDIGENVLFVVPKKEIMSHVRDYEEVQKEIQRKKTLEKIFIEENKMKPIQNLDMPTEDELTPLSRSTNTNLGHYQDASPSHYMPGIREQDDADENAFGDGEDPFLNQVLGNHYNVDPKFAPNDSGKTELTNRNHIFNFDDSEANRKLLSDQSSLSRNSKNWSMGTNSGSNSRFKGTVVFDSVRIEMPSHSNEARSFKIPDFKFEDYDFTDKKHRRFSNLF